MVVVRLTEANDPERAFSHETRERSCGLRRRIRSWPDRRFTGRSSRSATRYISRRTRLSDDLLVSIRSLCLLVARTLEAWKTFMARAVLAAFIGEVLLLSALFKAKRPQDYLEGFASYSRLRSLPSRQRSRLAVLVPVVEFIVALLLFLPKTVGIGAALAGFLLVSFYMLIAQDERELIANCGCWGQTSFRAPKKAYLVRNILLLASCVILFVVSFALPPPRSVLLFILSTGIALPFALLMLELPHITQIATVRPLERRE